MDRYQHSGHAASISTLRMKTACSGETLIPVYQTTQQNTVIFITNVENSSDEENINKGGSSAIKL
jgi:hypothetical protein